MVIIHGNAVLEIIIFIHFNDYENVRKLFRKVQGCMNFSFRNCCLFYLIVFSLNVLSQCASVSGGILYFELYAYSYPRSLVHKIDGHESKA